MRIAVAELAQETDSFSPLRATIADFESYGLFRGGEILERMRDAGPIGGLLEIAVGQPGKVELIPLLRAWAGAGGTIADAAFEELRAELLDRLRAALPVDAVFLVLHGAAAAESEDDVEGALLADVRQLVGDRVPIVVPLDHHVNITGRMVASADLLIGHETQPHDPVDTGRKAARLLFRMLGREIAPVMAWQKIPMITPQDQFLTSSGWRKHLIRVDTPGTTQSQASSAPLSSSRDPLSRSSTTSYHSESRGFRKSNCQFTRPARHRPHRS